MWGGRATEPKGVSGRYMETPMAFKELLYSTACMRPGAAQLLLLSCRGVLLHI